MGNILQNEERLHVRATLLIKIGTAVLRYGTVFILLLIGAQKWTAEEAAGIQEFTTHSPLFSWMYHLMSSQHASELIGVVELVIAGLYCHPTLVPDPLSDRQHGWVCDVSCHAFISVHYAKCEGRRGLPHQRSDPPRWLHSYCR